MLKISNTRVYGMNESIRASGYPMRADEIGDWDDEDLVNLPADINRATKLGTVPSGTGHDNFLKGIIVQFDIKYPIYWTPQFQRYNFADIVSSTSAMHRLHKLNLDESMNKYVLKSMKFLLSGLIEAYNYGLENKAKNITLVHPIGGDMVVGFCVDGDTKTIDSVNECTETITMYELYMRILSNCPQGLMKTMRVTTSYLQLKTIYLQRRHHKLKEDWGAFCDWCLTLPNFEEFCLKGGK